MIIYSLGVAAERWLQDFSWIALAVAVLVGVVTTLLLRRRTARLTADDAEDADAKVTEPVD